MKYKLLFTTSALIIGVTVFALIISGQRRSNDVDSTGKLQVAASFYPMYYFSSQIGGEKANVKNITPAGSEPHDYDLSTRDIATIEESKLLIVNGGVEPWADKVRSNLNNTTIVIAGEGFLTQEFTNEDGNYVKDPHIWLSPARAKDEVSKIYEGFIKVDPVNIDLYKGNKERLLTKLEQLDKDYKQGLKSCKSKEIITSHSAFGYLASDYGLTQISISGLSADEEPSARQLAEIATFAKENNVKYIFFESLVSPKLSETIAQEVGAKTMVLDPVEGITDEDMQNGKDYFSIMNENLNNLKIALECQL